MSHQSVNPYNGNLLKNFAELDDAQLAFAIATAETSYQSWKELSYAERGVIVAKAAKILLARVDEFARLETIEMGKLIAQVQGEVRYSADILAYHATNAEKFLRPEKPHPEHGEAHMESSSIGVICGVEPSNFPYYQLACVAGPQPMAGNVVMVKHAGGVPQCAIAFEKLWIEAGSPVGIYTNLQISHEQADRVIDDARIKGVALTGSVAAGRNIASRVGRNLEISSMELGGSDAFIVLDDADLERAIPWAVWGRMYNQGQTCCAAKRFIVFESIADEFLEKFKAALSLLEVGNPMDVATTKGPMSTESALVDLLRQVDSAVEHGGTVLMGGERMQGPGAFMATTILGDVKPGNPAFRDEFNNIDRSDAALPFGGIKNSGYGRELADMGIQQFVNQKLVRVVDCRVPA